MGAMKEKVSKLTEDMLASLTKSGQERLNKTVVDMRKRVLAVENIPVLKNMDITQEVRDAAPLVPLVGGGELRFGKRKIEGAGEFLVVMMKYANKRGEMTEDNLLIGPSERNIVSELKKGENVFFANFDSGRDIDMDRIESGTVAEKIAQALR